MALHHCCTQSQRWDPLGNGMCPVWDGRAGAACVLSYGWALPLVQSFSVYGDLHTHDALTVPAPYPSSPVFRMQGHARVRLHCGRLAAGDAGRGCSAAGAAAGAPAAPAAITVAGAAEGAAASLQEWGANRVRESFHVTATAARGLWVGGSEKCTVAVGAWAALLDTGRVGERG